MSSNDPLKLIEQYLERVRVYLPLDSEDAIIELQTHLIEEAERIGNSTMTAGSAMMAIERMGEPKSVANEYAGSGEKVGPVPAEYVNPVARIAVVLVGIAAAIIVGLTMLGIPLTQLFGADIQNWPVSIPIMIFLNVFIIVAIIGIISLFDREKPLTDKTTLESIFGLGVEGFKPKGRLDALGDLIMGVFWGIVLMIPAVVFLYTTAFAEIYMLVVVWLFLGAVRGALFYIGGENNFNLAVEGILSAVWIAIATVLINIGWPIRYVYSYSNGAWRYDDLMEFFTQNNIPMPFDSIWAFIMFITVVIAIWRIFVSTMKITMYLRADKGIWWQGNWGERRSLRTPLWKRVLGEHDQFQQKEQTVRHDEYTESDESQ
ncbi:MAG: hypothetical protein E4H14_19980 [Candidatus Thorarchaeota archaeon]|nr:MAG: hypothetical protein E4H14_19980 [Candidatus Thorarchaeota archaeon]